MKISEFDFELPEELIAQEPASERNASRMLHVDRKSASYSDAHFSSLPDYLEDGDLLVVNNTRVFPARIYGKTETGARVEAFLVRESDTDCWEVLAKPAKRLKEGRTIDFGNGLSGISKGRLEGGKVEIQFSYEGSFDEILDSIGSTPLPPYIKRDTDLDSDRERYQTVYAKERGAIAAPTAGLHFNDEVFEALDKKGVETCEITLHVGYGTFEPVRVEDLSDHSVSSETFEITEAVSRKLSNAKKDGQRIVAVGTTSTRALESGFEDEGFIAGKRETSLTITPGYQFRAVDALLTNFHLPQSSLLVLISTFAGRDLTLEAYKHAVGQKYRFYSYGDCMLIT